MQACRRLMSAVADVTKRPGIQLACRKLYEIPQGDGELTRLTTQQVAPKTVQPRRQLSGMD